jgi:hypothetical protein
MRDRASKTVLVISRAEVMSVFPTTTVACTVVIVATVKLKGVAVALEYITNKLVMVLTSNGVAKAGDVVLIPRTITCTTLVDDDAYSVPVPSPGVPCITALSSST